MFYYDVIGVFGQSLAWSWLLDFLNGTYDFKLQIMSIMFYRCTWYPLFMVTTFPIDIIKSGKLEPLIYGANFTFSVNLFHAECENLCHYYMF